MMKKFIFAAIVLTAQLCSAAETFRVVDGDSLERGGERIRLLDIDAPEFLQNVMTATDGNTAAVLKPQSLCVLWYGRE